MRRLPLLLCATLLGLGAVLLAAALAMSGAGLPPMKLVPSLRGVTALEQPRWTWPEILSGRAQNAWAHAVAAQFPFYPWAVRTRNQVEYSLLHTLPDTRVLVAADGTLIEGEYALEYCSRDLAAWRPGAAAWASTIRRMQDWAEAHGKTFLYVLTPSKVAQYPELLPWNYSCPSPQADRLGLVPEWLALLHQAGVHVADTTGPVMQAHGRYPFRLYPPGGTHWNAVGLAIAQQTILGALFVQRPDPGFAPFTFTWHMVPHPSFPDDDLASLTNLFVKPENGPVPAVTAQRTAPPAVCRPPRVAIVGGSFSHGTLQYLAEQPCPVPAVEYEYWSAYTLHWEGDGIAGPRGADDASRAAAILGADVLIYEENEEILRNPTHGRALWAFLQAHR